MTQEVRYNSGNLFKYYTGNQLKIKLIERFDLRLFYLFFFIPI